MEGTIREKQNWNGGKQLQPCSAAFVPPPPEYVPELLADLCDFANTDSLSAATQAVLAHAQFETIHPFVDGNGRIGRALVHLVLRRQGLAARALPPISLVLATWSRDHTDGHTATRYRGSPASKVAQDGLNRWVGLFATACRRAVSDAETFENEVSDLQTLWRARFGTVRRGSAVDLLIHALPGVLIVTVNGAADLMRRSFQATNEAISRLTDAGILKQGNVGRRNRAFEASKLIRRFTALERRLASPAGNTGSSEPSRSVPRRAVP